MKYYGPRGRDKRGQLIFFLPSIQCWFRALTAKTDAPITVHKFGNRAKRRAKTVIMTYCSAANLRETLEVRAKHHPTKNKYNIWFWGCVFAFGSLEVSLLVTQPFDWNRGRHHGNFEVMWLRWWTNFRLRLWLQPPGPRSPPTRRAHPNSSTTSEDELRRVQIAVDASFWPQCVSLSYGCQNKKKKTAFTSKESVSASDSSEVSTHRVQCCRQRRRFQTILPFCDSTILQF